MILIGNLGRSPKFGATATGKSRCVLSLATSKQWKDKNTGEPVQHTEWHRVHVYNRLAEVCNDYLKKGSKVFIEGENRNVSWIDESTGEKRYMHYVHGNNMQMLDAVTRNSDGAYEQPVRQNDNGSQASYSATDPVIYDNLDDDLQDDIPF